MGDLRRAQAFGLLANGPPRFRFDLEVEAGGKADGAKHSQRIVKERDAGFEGRPQDAGPQVGERLPGQVEHFARVQVFKQGVDGEIAAEHVVVQGGGPHVGLARVGVVAFGAGGHEFHRAAGRARISGVGDVDHGRAEARVFHGVVLRHATLIKELRQGNGVAFQNQVKVIAGRQAKRAVAQKAADKVQSVLIRAVPRGIAQAGKGTLRGVMRIVVRLRGKRIGHAVQYTTRGRSGVKGAGAKR